MPELHEGDDPRVVFGKHHKERGPAKFFFTFEDVADLVELKVATVRLRFSLKQSRASLLLAVAQLIQKHLARRSRRLSEEELRVFFETPERLEQWEGRWPRFDLYWCGGCEEVLVEAGLCPSCGGSRPGLHLLGDEFYVRVGNRNLPFRWLLHPDRAPRGSVRVRDGNWFNNRPENLELLAFEEGQRRFYEGRKQSRAGGALILDPDPGNAVS